MKIALVSDNYDGLDDSIRNKGFFVEKYPCSQAPLLSHLKYDYVIIFDNGAIPVSVVEKIPPEKSLYFSKENGEVEKSDILKIKATTKRFTSHFNFLNYFFNGGYPLKWANHCFDEKVFYNKNQEPKFDCFLDGNFDEEFIKKIKNKFKIFKGHKYLTKPKKSDIFNKSKLVVCGNKENSISRTVFEAGACGNLVLVNKIPSHGDMEKLFENGVHVAVYENEGDCINKIKMYSSDKEERDAVGKNLENLVNKYHSSKKRAKNLIIELKK